MLPLTKAVLETLDKARAKGITLIHINHDVDDVYILNNYLKSLFEDVIFIPVSYKSKRSESIVSGNGEAISWDIGQRIADTLMSLRNKNVIIIEDGGHHYACLDKTAAKDTRIIGCIEQTMSGLKRALGYQGLNRYKFYSVARSRIKMRVENKFIARKVIEESSLLLNLSNSYLLFRNIYVIGYGILGREIASCLKYYPCGVEIIETNEKILDQARIEGFRANSRLMQLAKNPIVIGATGTPSFGQEELFEFIRSDSEKLTLISVSSKQIEFEEILRIKEWIEKFELKLISVKTDLRYGTNIVFQHENTEKEIVLIADGRPVNFYRDESESLPMSVIDLINAEIVFCLRKVIEENFQSNYLFGHCREDEEFETGLLQKWLQKEQLKNDLSVDPWVNFSKHPNEEILTQAVLKEQIYVNRKPDYL